MAEIITTQKSSKTWILWLVIAAILIFLLSILLKKCDGPVDNHKAEIDSLRARYQMDSLILSKRQDSLIYEINLLKFKTKINDSIIHIKNDDLAKSQRKVDELIARVTKPIVNKQDILAKLQNCDSLVIAIQDERREDTAIHIIFMAALNSKDDVIHKQDTLIAVQNAGITVQQSTINRQNEFLRQFSKEMTTLSRQKRWSDTKGRIAAGVGIVGIVAAVVEGFVIKNK